MKGQSYRELIVWQKAMDLVVQIYRHTADWPASERFGLTSQVQRAAVSVPANIAEDQGRSSNGDFLRFLSIAHGSLCELETHLIIAQRLGFASPGAHLPLMEQAANFGRLLNGVMKSLK